MHRIDTPTAQPDKFGPGKNGFTGGNPQTGQLPTALDQDFFDALQEEIARVVEGAGLELDKQNHGQMLMALGMMFASKDSVDGKQPLSDTLTILASLMAGANKLPYFTGNDTAAVTDLTAIGRNIIGKGSIADVLSYLGLSEAPNALNKNNNLSELTDRAAARKNLGLGEEASVSLGVNQRWQVVTGSRSVGVTYTNTSGRPIQILLDFFRPNTSWTVNITIDGLPVSGAGGYCPVIPNNSTYRVDASGIANLTWRELR